MEIDKIFLDSSEIKPDEKRIENLKEYSKDVESIVPIINRIQKNIKSLKVDYDVYNVQLESLSKDLDSIQKESTELEEKLSFETILYEKLKKLSLSLNIDNENFQVIENCKFDQINDLEKMESSLEILTSFEIDKYKIRIVKELKQKIIETEKNFYKRFIFFLNKIFVKSESTGELRVHKNLYKMMIQYKFIYRNCKKYNDYFSIIKQAYITHSKILYEKEFQSHIKSIIPLVDDLKKVNVCIEVLIKSFDSLISCEINFLKNLYIDNINESVIEIFKNSINLIFEFIDKMFSKSKSVAIISLNQFVNNEEKSSEVHKKFYEDLSSKYFILEELFLKEIKENLNMNTLNQIMIQDNMGSLKNKVLDINLKSLLKNIKNYKIDKLIKKYQIIYKIETKKSPELILMKNDSLELLNKNIVIKTIEYIFKDENEEENVQSLINMIDYKIDNGSNEILQIIRNCVLENIDKDKIDKINEIFSNINKVI